jgi:hypothetical protein
MDDPDGGIPEGDNRGDDVPRDAAPGQAPDGDRLPRGSDH